MNFNQRATACAARVLLACAAVLPAVSQAAYVVLSDCYPEYQANIDADFATRMGAVPNGAAIPIWRAVCRIVVPGW